MAGRRYCSLMKTIHHFCCCTCICLKSCVDEINLDLKRDALHFLRTHFFFGLFWHMPCPLAYFLQSCFTTKHPLLFLWLTESAIFLSHIFEWYTPQKYLKRGDFLFAKGLFSYNSKNTLVHLWAGGGCHLQDNFFCIKKEHKILKCMQMLFPWWDSRGGALRVCDAHTLKRSEKPLSLCHTTKSISHLRSFFGLMLFKD